jgi:hypothetical protein
MNKRVLFIILFGLVLNTFAQEIPKAIKIAEFDDRIESVSVFTRRVKQVLTEIDARPTGTRVFIVISQKNFKLSQNLIDIADKIVSNEGREKQQLIIVTDSFCPYEMKTDKSEFWILPKGVEPPYPNSGICDYVCSTIEIQGKPHFPNKNEVLTFTVTVSGIDPSAYKWTVVGGRLLSGQNSPTISVRIKKSARLGNGDAVTVTVNIPNIPARTMCPDSVSFTSVLQPTPLFD